MMQISEKRKKAKKKLIFLGINVIVFITVAIFIINQGLNVFDIKEISYINNADIEYSVYLKENNYYENNHLENKDKYIASLIDSINVIYNYNLSSENKMSGNYNYYISGELVINETGKEDILLKKDYKLTEEKNIDFSEQNNININENVSIDYDKYNDLAASFKKDFDLSIEAYLIVKLNVGTNITNGNDNYPIETIPYIKIPLSEKTIAIDIKKYEDEENVDVITFKEKSIFKVILVIVGSIILLFNIILGIKVIRKSIAFYKTRNKYQVKLNKIFNDYDQIITNSNKLPEYDENDVLDVTTFEELVDAQSEIHKPIIFYETIENEEAIFILFDDKSIFRYKVLAKDLKK